jgi:hypothetical protein
MLYLAVSILDDSSAVSLTSATNHVFVAWKTTRDRDESETLQIMHI